MLSVNISELVWTIINFFLLFFVLKRFLFDPIGKHLDARQAKIDAGMAAQAQANETVQANRERLAEEKEACRLEASRILTDAEAEDEKRRSENRSAAKSRAKDSLGEGKAQLAAQNAQEEALLDEKSGELTALLTARILDAGD